MTNNSTQAKSVDSVDGRAQQITEALAMAAALDEAAREYRKAAGRMLAEVRSTDPMGNGWYASVGLDQSSAELLVELGIGAIPAGHAR